MKRRTFLTLFASIPAVAMAQRAIPAVLGEPQLIRANERGWWCIAVDKDRKEICRVQGTRAKWSTCIAYDSDGNPLFWKDEQGLEATFPTVLWAPSRWVAGFEMHFDGTHQAWGSYDGVITCATTMRVRWAIT